MLQPVNLPDLTGEYRWLGMAPLLARIAELDNMIDSMASSTERAAL